MCVFRTQFIKQRCIVAHKKFQRCLDNDQKQSCSRSRFKLIDIIDICIQYLILTSRAFKKKEFHWSYNLVDDNRGKKEM